LAGQKEKRKLAAVMFADICGYTAIMQEDEDRAKVVRKKFKSAIDELVKEYNGEIIQYMGDGALIIFSSGLEAVDCAIEIQHILTKEPMVPLRIGLHIGDVVIDEVSIYGDSVNISSRIESLSVPGGILISGKLFDEIKNHKHIKTKSLGEFGFKNVKNKIEVFAIINEGVKEPKINELEGKLNKPENIAGKSTVFIKTSLDEDSDNIELLKYADEYLRKYTYEDTNKAFRLYKEAVSENPGSAKANAGLSLCYLYSGMNHYFTRNECYKSAGHYALKSLDINRKTVLPNIAMAMVSLFSNNNTETSFKYFSECFKISNESKLVNLYYTYYLLTVQKPDEALQSLIILENNQEALSLLFSTYLILGKFEKADDIISRINKSGDGFAAKVKLYKAILLLAKGKYSLAMKILDEYNSNLNDKEITTGYQCYAINKVYGIEHAKKNFKENLTAYPNHTQRAIAYNVFNDIDNANKCLDMALQNKEPARIFAHINPFLKGLL